MTFVRLYRCLLRLPRFFLVSLSFLSFLICAFLGHDGLTLVRKQVLSGGAFDIDFVVKDPNAQVLNSGNAEKDGEFLFVVEEVGEYSFCFSNAMSTFVTKTLSFDILMAGDAKPVVKKPAQPAASPDLTPIQDSINAAREGLSKIERQLQYYRTRERVRTFPFMIRLAAI